MFHPPLLLRCTSPLLYPSSKCQASHSQILPPTELPRICPHSLSRHPPFLPHLAQPPNLNRNNRLRSTRPHPHVHSRNILYLPRLRRPHARPVPKTRHDANPLAWPQDAFLYPEIPPHCHHRGFLSRNASWEEHVEWGCAEAGRRGVYV